MSKFIRTLSTAAAVATLGFAGTAAFAQEATYEYPQAAVSSVTRAQVQAELAQAKADGSLRVWSTQFNPFAVSKSLKSRSEVRAEVLGSGHDTINAYTGEDSGSFAIARQGGVRHATVLAAR